jgi:hypothetical protein
MRENEDGVTGTTTCEACDRAHGSGRAVALRAFHECAMSDEAYRAVGKGMKQTRRGRPSNKSKSEVQALDAEVSDETFWSLVKKSQIRPSEEPSFDRVDLFSGDDGRGQMTSDDKDDEAFIDGLIRMPSFTMLDAEMNVRVDGSAANFGTPSPAESSGAPVRQAYNNIFESSQATGQMSRARATSQSDSAAAGIDSMFMPGGVRSSNEHVEELLAPRVDGERNMFYDIDAAGQWRMKKPKKSGRPKKMSAARNARKPAATNSSAAYAANAPDHSAKLPGGASRQQVLDRYHEKRKARTYGKTIHYEARKVRAETRVRVGGRFAKAEDRSCDVSIKGAVPA